MIELSEEQQRALDAEPEPCFVDPRTNETYVLVRMERYERLHALSRDGEGLDMKQVALLVDRAMSEDDANDPTLEFYQEKYGKKP